MTPAVLLGEPAAESPEARRLADDRLLERYHREGDLEARDELVLRFMPLARQLAARYRHAGEPLEDLVQVACVGLIKAVADGSITSGNHVGKVGLAPFHDLDSKVPPDVKSKLEQIRKQLDDGSLKTNVPATKPKS